MNEFIPLRPKYAIELIARAIDQDAGVVLDQLELGWLRYALAPLNVPDEDLTTAPLCVAEMMCRLLSRGRASARVAHMLGAGFFDLNGYGLEIPAARTRQYRELMGLMRDSAVEAEQVARFLAVHVERRAGYEAPYVDPPSGNIAMTVSEIAPGSTESLEKWYAALSAAVVEAGEEMGLNLQLDCLSRIKPSKPELGLDAWSYEFKRADAQIVVGFMGETTTGGYEQAFLGLGRPWIWLTVGEATVPMSVRSWAKVTGGVIVPAATLEAAAELVREWVREQAGRLRLNIYLRETTGLLSFRVYYEMKQRWTEVDDVDRARVARATGLEERMIGHVLSSPVLYARTPLETLDVLAAALGVAFDTAIAARPMGSLGKVEEEALNEYIEERELSGNGLSGREALELRSVGARLTAVERRRFALTTPEGWETLHDGRSGRR